jgi:2-polyprenyl-6-methoxyphenol hydroxylase-like FAD-dependent oxidoreductase
MHRLLGFILLQPLLQGTQSWSFSPLKRLSRCKATVSIRAVNDVRNEGIETADAVVCGGGPAGLLTAIMLAEKLPPSQKIRLYDRLSAPPDADDDRIWDNDVARFYLIGLGGRGQSALQEFGAWEGVVKDRCVSVVGRRDWQPGDLQGTERIFTESEKRVPTEVLARDKLVGVLHQHILDKYKGRIELNYGFEVHPVDFKHENGKSVLVEIAQCTSELGRLNPSEVKTSVENQEEILCSTEDTKLLKVNGLLVAADGTVRTVANAMEREDRKRFDALNPIQKIFAPKPFCVKRYDDDNQRVYKSFPIDVPKDWRFDLNYSARAKRATFDALPANRKGNYCGLLLLKKDDPLAVENNDPKELRAMMDNSFPYFSKLVDDDTMATVAKKPVSYLPSFRYAGPRLFQGNNCVMLGDCVHTVKPYFGLGANSALEDVRILGQAIDKYKEENGEFDTAKVVREFSKRRAKDAKVLVRVSRDLDRPGKLGVFTFLIPIILDSIFSKFLPAIFTPNIINMLQREGWTFSGVARRKRLERVLQVAMLTSGFYLAGRVATRALKWTATKLLALCQTSVAARYAIPAAALSFVATFLASRSNETREVKDLPAVADVISKFSKKSEEKQVTK